MPSKVEHWTDSRYWSFIRSALRRAFTNYPNKYKALAAVKVKNRGGGRAKFKYRCNSCKKLYPAKQISVDHIEPCGSIKSYEDIATFTERLFCGVEGLQVLCKHCHDTKTLKDRGLNPKLVAFKKKKAAAQKAELKKLGLPEGKNAKERIEIYASNV